MSALYQRKLLYSDITIVSQTSKESITKNTRDRLSGREEDQDRPQSMFDRFRVSYTGRTNIFPERCFVARSRVSLARKATDLAVMSVFENRKRDCLCEKKTDTSKISKARSFGFSRWDALPDSQNSRPSRKPPHSFVRLGILRVYTWFDV